MILRPPSAQRHYDNFYSGDAAFDPPPDAPGLAEHRRKVAVARETGDWSGLLTNGAHPTKFVMRPIPGNVVRRLIDRATSGDIGAAELNAIAFRAAIVSIENFDGYKVVMGSDDGYGRIATKDVVDDLDAIDLGIVGELGGCVLERARGVLPK